MELKIGDKLYRESDGVTATVFRENNCRVYAYFTKYSKSNQHHVEYEFCFDKKQENPDNLRKFPHGHIENDVWKLLPEKKSDFKEVSKIIFTIDGDEFLYEVGYSNNQENRILIKIEEHLAAFEGDKMWYDLHFDNGNLLRIFNPTLVHFSTKQQ